MMMIRSLFVVVRTVHIRQHARTLSISRMLDMGGAPSALHDQKATRINTSKNSQVQALCFDFDVLTRALDSTETDKARSKQQESSRIAELGKVQPNVDVVQQVANLLNVELGGNAKKAATRPEEEDDLSLLLGDEKKKEDKKQKVATKPTMPISDVRAKYADKLAKKGVTGGITAVELAKHEVEDTLKRGDAAGHLAARKVAVSEPTLTGKSKWLALSGTGNLLKYLTLRSIKIALLPRPVNEINKEEGERMEDFKRQLNDVVFDILFKDGTLGTSTIVQEILSKLKLDPKLVLLVSDRDDYLRSAKEAGMVTCRIRPMNARRGNISAHYNVPTVPEVQDVLNEINGISFNAVLQGR